MMLLDSDFRTKVVSPPRQGLIDYDTPVTLLGSCFSDNIGLRMTERWFDVMSNPFGPLYNPASISMWIKRLASGAKFSSDELFYAGGRYSCYWCHTALSRSDKNTMLNELNDKFEYARDHLLRSKLVILTLGTAYVYSLVEGGAVVANCHKMPASTFTRRKLNVTEISSVLIDAMAHLRAVVSHDVEFMFTVSPIRHLSDGFHGNQLSKASLLLAIDDIMAQDKSVTYFPAFEIMMDDLRDYRFYDRDMSHPSSLAADYIYNNFSNAYMSDTVRETACQCYKITKRASHRHMTDDLDVIKKFNNETIRQGLQLVDKYPKLAVTANKILKIQ